MTPDFLDLVLAATVPDAALRDAISGDLREEHAELCVTRGRLRAKLWLLRQVVASIPRFASLTGSSLVDSCSGRAAARFYFALSLLVGVGVATALGIDALGRWTAGSPMILFALAAVAECSLYLGYLAAGIAPRAPLNGAIAVSAVSLSVGVGGLLLGDFQAPAWFVVASQLLAVPAALAGALLSVRSRERAAALDCEPIVH